MLILSMAVGITEIECAHTFVIRSRTEELVDQNFIEVWVFLVISGSG